MHNLVSYVICVYQDNGPNYDMKVTNSVNLFVVKDNLLHT